jgi:hypothetical protein
MISGPIPATVTADTMIVYWETPEIDFQVQAMQAVYQFAEHKDTIFRNQNVMVQLPYRTGLSDVGDRWAYVLYKIPIYIEQRIEEIDGEEVLSSDTTWEYKEGWVIESVEKDELFFLDYPDQRKTERGYNFNLLDFDIFLHAQTASGEAILGIKNNHTVNYRWWGAAVVGIAMIQFVLVFVLVKWQNPKYRFYSFIAFLIVDGLCLMGLKISVTDIILILKGKI